MNDQSNAAKGSVLYISHGGGPLPLLGEPSHQELVAFLKNVSGTLHTPSAIIVVSAHWEAEKPTITSGSAPSLIYDYSGFPEQAYQIKYPAPGNPLLAKKISDLLANQGIDAELSDQRGFDHGLFIPLKIMYPDASIPCVQLSLVKGLKPADHIRIGKALAALMDERVLIIGSGFSFHNMKAFFTPPTNETQAMNESFEKWLMDTCATETLSENEREQRLTDWESAPNARYCHPREEHLLPLHVCYGVASKAARKVYTFEILGRKASGYLW